MPTRGWAVCHKNIVQVATVAPTRRAAIVNWLATDKDIMALAECPDDVLEKLWKTLRDDADVVEVAIKLHHADGPPVRDCPDRRGQS